MASESDSRRGSDLVPKYLDDDNEDLNPAWLLRPEDPGHRIANLVDKDDIRRCLRHEGESDEPRQDVIAKLNKRLQTVREADEPVTEVGPISVDEAESIAALFDRQEVLKQLRSEQARDEPREAVVEALKNRLSEVTNR